ncbi:hypothetical protein J1N35_044192, partial [Gossypium stocksii]
LLRVPIMLIAKRYSSQREMVSKNFVFDLGDYCFLLLIEGFESWFPVVQNYNFRMLHVSGTLPLKNFLTHIDKVIKNHSTPFVNQGPCDDESFFVSKWPNLRTSHFEEWGMM